MENQVKKTAKELKRILAGHLYYRLGCGVVCDEFEFIDLLAIRRTGYVVEYEIKISKADFEREIKCILMQSCEAYGKDWEKFSKHKLYLTGERPSTSYDTRLADLGISNNVSSRAFRPSEFYFYVTEELGQHATKRVQELGLPYGVVICNKWGYGIIKQAVKLHKEKASDSLYRRLAHALTIRSRLFS